MNQAGAPALRRLVKGVRWKYVLVPLTVAWIVSFVEKINVSLVIANKGFLQETGLQGHFAVLGLLGGIFLLTYGLSMFFWGILCDRWGPRRTILLATLIWGIAEFGFASSHTLTQLFASRVLLGIGEGFSWPVSLAITARWFPMKERAFANGVWLDGSNIGSVFAMPLMALMVAALGWAAPFWLLGALSIGVVAPLFLWLFRDSPEEDDRVTEEERAVIAADTLPGDAASITSVRPVLRSVPFWLLTLVLCVGGIQVWGLVTWFPAFLVQGRHLAFTHAGWLSSGPFLGALIIAPLGGYLATRFGGRAWWMMLGCAVTATGFWIGVLLPSTTWAVIFISVGFGCAVGLTSVPCNALLHTLAPAHMMGRVGGLGNAINSLVSFGAPFAIGVLIAASGGRFVSAFVMMAIVTLIGLAATIPLVLYGLDRPGAPSVGAVAASR